MTRTAWNQKCIQEIFQLQPFDLNVGGATAHDRRFVDKTTELTELHEELFVCSSISTDIARTRRDTGKM